MGRIPGPVNLYDFRGAARDMHSRPALLFLLLDVVAELRVHQRLGILEPAFFKIFRPEELLVHAVSKQFVFDMLKIRHFPVCGFLGRISIGMNNFVNFPIG